MSSGRCKLACVTIPVHCAPWTGGVFNAYIMDSCTPKWRSSSLLWSLIRHRASPRVHHHSCANAALAVQEEQVGKSHGLSMAQQHEEACKAHRPRPCTCSSSSSTLDMPVSIARHIRQSVAGSPQRCIEQCGVRRGTQQRTIAQEGASILDVRNVVRVTQPTVAAELLGWVGGALLDGPCLAPPVCAAALCFPAGHLGLCIAKMPVNLIQAAAYAAHHCMSAGNSLTELRFSSIASLSDGTMGAWR